jgi:hypothetical protein
LVATLGVTITAVIGYVLVAAATADEAFLLAIFLPIVLLPLTRILLRAKWAA